MCNYIEAGGVAGVDAGGGRLEEAYNSEYRHCGFSGEILYVTYLIYYYEYTPKVQCSKVRDWNLLGLSMISDK